ncbi:hypothetical protein [Mesorhizobium caraganae]|uniref:hypothetical protein n=1 Tax=Mesorhizobium caraganae TaxID=483206 RepID=UPI0035E3C6CD
MLVRWLNGLEQRQHGEVPTAGCPPAVQMSWNSAATSERSFNNLIFSASNRAR